MYYEIIANRFAPKRSDLLLEPYSRSHSICYGKCNFHCRFCDFQERPANAYRTFDDIHFAATVKELSTKGHNFKFTGGEPTLNPCLETHLQIVKDCNGYVYLDSNGSNPDILEKLIEKNLIDVLGVSLKGITSDEAMESSQVKNPKLVWQNVWKTIDMASQHSDRLRTIVTLIFTEENYHNRLENFGKLLQKYPNIYMKINNLQCNKNTLSFHIHSLNSDILLREISIYVDENPRWKGHIIYVPNEQGVSDYNSLYFF